MKIKAFISSLSCGRLINCKINGKKLRADPISIARHTLCAWNSILRKKFTKRLVKKQLEIRVMQVDVDIKKNTHNISNVYYCLLTGQNSTLHFCQYVCMYILAS